MEIKILKFSPQPEFKVKSGKKSGWTSIGTVALYIQDLDLDVRGIEVFIKGGEMLFLGPRAREYINGKYGYINAFSFYEEETKNEFYIFLQAKVKPYVKACLRKIKKNSKPKILENQLLTS
jgi:hypothetical protein